MCQRACVYARSARCGGIKQHVDARQSQRSTVPSGEHSAMTFWFERGTAHGIYDRMVYLGTD